MTAKLLGIVLFVLVLWAGVEIFTKGTDGAFGGLFARLSGKPPAAEHALPIPKRIGQKVQHELNDAMERRMGNEEDND
jgi:hypothetical protein